MPMTHCWVGWCWVKGSSAPTPSHQQRGWRCTRRWERTQPGWLIPTDPRHTPCLYDIVLNLESWGKKGGRRGHSEEWQMSSKIREPCFAVDGFPWVMVQEFLVLHYLYHSPTSFFSLLPFQFSPPSHWEESELVAAWGSHLVIYSSCCLRLNHNSVSSS